MAIATINPATGELVKKFEPLTDAEVEAKVKRAAETFPEYRKVPFAERARRMLRAAEILEAEKDACGRLMTLEMGKPLKAAVAEAAKCATDCRNFGAQELRAVPADRTGAGGDALEFSFLAGVSVCSPGADGG
jgi:succinate-semialdehyde dehydrogenase/glutarate-semialdehyde dehydrogenase